MFTTNVEVLTGMLSEQLYKHVDTNDMLPSEQKGCRKETRGTKDQLLIDRMTFKNCKRRHTNLAMAYVDYVILSSDCVFRCKQKDTMNIYRRTLRTS